MKIFNKENWEEHKKSLIRYDFDKFLNSLKIDIINKDLVNNTDFGAINLPLIYKDLLKENQYFAEYSYGYDIPCITKNEDGTIISTKDKIVFRPVLYSKDSVIPKNRKFNSYEKMKEVLQKESNIINFDNIENNVVIFILESYPQLYKENIILSYVWVKVCTMLDISFSEGIIYKPRGDD